MPKTIEDFKSEVQSQLTMAAPAVLMAPGGGSAPMRDLTGGFSKLDGLFKLIEPYLAALPVGKWQKAVQAAVLLYEALHDAVATPETTAS